MKDLFQKIYKKCCKISYYYFYSLFVIYLAYKKGGKFFWLGNLAVLILMLLNLVLFYSIVQIWSEKGLAKTFHLGIGNNNLYHTGEDFHIVISQEDDLPKTSVISRYSKLSAKLINTHLKSAGSNLNWFNKIIPTAKAEYNLTDQVSVEYRIIKDPQPGQIVSSAPAGLKEDIILKTKDAPRIFQFELEMENISRYAQIDGNWYFYDFNNKPVFYIPLPFMSDAKGETSYSVLQEVRKTDQGKTMLYLAADSDWLDAESRAWPVKIDPSVVVSGGIATDGSETRYGGLQRKSVYVNGNWYAFYNDGADIFYKKSADGTSWGSAVDVAAADADNYNPSVWLEGSYIYVAWIDDSADTIEFDQIDTSASDGQLTTECSSADQGSLDTSTFTVSIAVADDGTVYVAYSDTSTDTEDGIFKVTSVASCAGGTNWTDINSATTTEDVNVDLTTNSSPWIVPSDFTSTNTIRAIGGGGAGDNSSTTAGQGGGGGGAYASITNLNLGVGSSITYNVGVGATDGMGAGGITWFNAASAAACTDSSNCVKAGGGSSATSETGGAGGTLAASIGTTLFGGGAGGTGNAAGADSTGGGGGAGGSLGIGATGGNGDTDQFFDDAQGGGGGSGGGNAGTNGGTEGGAGGDSSYDVSSGGAGGTGGGAGQAGTNGGGGGGGDQGGNGGAGGDGNATFDISKAGGGGGGGDDDSGGVGGRGGFYGGGGGGGATVGIGATGVIAITYTRNITVAVMGDGDLPVLVAAGNTIHLVTQNGDLSYYSYNGSSWTTVDTTIASVTDTTYDMTTDGTSLWLLSLSGSTGTKFYKYSGSWSNHDPPWSGQTNVLSVSLTYDTARAQIVAHIIKDTSEQAYYKITPTSSTAWGGETSYNFTAGDLSDISGPLSITTTSDPIGVVLRQGSNFEFSSTTQPTASRMYLKFDDTLGVGTTAQDFSSFGNDGIVSGSTWQTEDQCIAGKCLLFDGSNDIVSVSDPSNGSLDFSTTESFAVEAWVKHNGAITTNPDYILTKATASSVGYKLYMDASGDFCFDIRDGNGNNASACTSGVDFDDDKWHHAVGVRHVSDDKLYLYVDGAERASTTDTTTATLVHSNTLYAGVDRDGTSNPWAGFIDEVKVIFGARSASQVRADFNSRGSVLGTSVNLDSNHQNNPNALSNGLVGYWKMNESSGDASDSSGNSLTLTNNNTTPFASGKFGNAGSFTAASSHYFSTATILNGVKTVAFWVNPTATTDEFINLTSAIYITASSGTVSASGFSSPDIYVNGVLNGTITANVWNHIVVTTQTGINANVFEIGRANSSHVNGKLDEIRLYSRTLGLSEVNSIYNFTPGPVGWWKFDEKSGTTAYDSSGNENSATLTNSPTYTPGKFGAGLNFAGSDAHVTRADDPDFDFAAGTSFTYTAWIKHTTASAQQIILAKFNGAASEGGYKMIMESDGDLTCAIDFDNTWTPADSATSTAATYDDSKWHHVACVKNEDSSLSLYIDGVLITSDTALSATTTLANSDPLYIGIDADGTSNDFVGQIDDVKIYNYALAEGTLTTSLNAENPAPGSPVGSAIGWWKFDEGALNTCSGGTNDFCDTSVNTNDLAFSTTTAGYTNSGKSGKAFDGTGAVWASRADDDDFDFAATNDFSISIWFKSDSATNPSATEYLFNKASATIQGYAVYAQTDGTICFAIDDDTTWTPDVASCTTSDFYDANWHHLLAVRDTVADTTRIYIDAISRDSDTDTTTTTLANSLTMYIADRDGTDNGDEFAGDLDDVKVYRLTLTASQVSLDMNRGSAQILGALGNNSSYQLQAANQEYCVPDSSDTCSAPFARWDFNEKTGTTQYDSSGNENNGTFSGDTSPPYVVAKVGSGLDFDGSDDLIEVANDGNFILSNSWTWEGWVKAENLDAEYIFFSKADTASWASGGKIIYVGTDDIISWNQFGGPTVRSDTVISANTWYYAAFVHDASADTMSIYINGVLENSASTTLAADDGNDVVRIADRVSSTNLPGVMDEIRFFTYTRTASQIAYDYNRGGPVGWWKMDECSGTTVYDATSNANNGTWDGTVGTNTSSGNCTTTSTSTARYNGVSGKRNYSLDFDGSDDVVTVTIANPIDFDVGLSSGMSFAAWVYAASDGEGDVGEIIDKGSATYLRVDSQDGSNNLDFEAQIDLGTTDPNVNVSDAFAINTWNHVAITYADDSDDDMLVYINGALRGTGDGSGAPATTDTNNLLIGGSSTANFDGQIDDVRAYNYALTAAQVKNIMNDGAIRYGPATGAP